MKFGISDKSYTVFVAALEQFPEIESAAIFGSRAMGNYKPGSDVDVVIIGENVTAKTVSALSAMLNERLPLPYLFDVVNYVDINNVALKDHIDTYALPVC